MDVRWLLHAAATLGEGASVVGAFLLTYAVHSTVLLLAAWWLVSRRPMAWAPASQHAIWGVALVAGWVTSAAHMASPWHPLGGAVELPRESRGAVAAVRVVQQGARFDSHIVRAGRTPSKVRETEQHPLSRDVWRHAAPPTPAATVPPPLPPVAPRFAAPNTSLAMVQHPRPLLERSAAALPPALGEKDALRVIVLAVSPITVAVAIWAVVAALLLLHLALSRRRLLASLANRRDASGSLAGSALRYLASRAGTRRTISLSVSDTLPSPAAISRSEIVVPTRTLHALSLAEQEGVLAHELAHVMRGDPAWLRLATWIERIAWFQPLNRVARRHMQLSAEFAADAWAVRLTRQPLRLAQALARVAEWLSAGGPAVATHAPGLDGSPFVERVRRLVGPQQPRSPLAGRLAHSAMWLVAAGVLAVVPRLQATPTTAGTLERVERVVFDFAKDGAPAAHPISSTRFQGAPRLRIVRLDGEPLRLPLLAADSSAHSAEVRRAVFLTSRAKS